MKKFLIASYFLVIFILFLYSYTQVDLSLTFSRIDFLRDLVKSFQYIGYFNRPLSTFIFIFIMVFLVNFYLIFILYAITKKINVKTFWKIIIATTIILTFSYNAFSHDIFNYIFDAKIITHYQQNPYEHKALDFPSDPMLSFMHWTHRVYPYGPFWLVLTAPLSYLGANLFIPTFFFFKLLMSASLLGSIYFIKKIMDKINPKSSLLSMVVFGLNPLILVESLVSSHLDIVMVFFALWSFYLLIRRKYLLAIFLLILSIGIKFVTAALIPVFILILIMQIKDKKINWDLILLISTILLIIPIIYISHINNFQPWYLIDIIFIAALISLRYYILIPITVISFFSLFNYAPYLYLGNWDPPVPELILSTNLTSYIITILAIGMFKLLTKNAKDNKSKNVL